jgi:hypothetical protein
VRSTRFGIVATPERAYVAVTVVEPEALVTAGKPGSRALTVPKCAAGSAQHRAGTPRIGMLALLLSAPLRTIIDG